MFKESKYKMAMSGRSRRVISTERGNHGLKVALVPWHVEMRPGAAGLKSPEVVGKASRICVTTL